MSGQLARPDTWEFISPAMPDSLQELGNGHYLAKWWRPVPMHEVQLLLQVRGIKIHREPYEPENLPEGMAVRFSIEHEVPVDESPYTDDEGFTIESRRQAILTLQKTGS